MTENHEYDQTQSTLHLVKWTAVFDKKLHGLLMKEKKELQSNQVFRPMLFFKKHR
ncbi:MAG: hypothetical protein CM15mP32_3760 [Flavobacteriaceae bacterium]|nr:MAG: hypothetical protein CM15mP32_3760 [Flavobacteriaceae bacterium]